MNQELPRNRLATSDQEGNRIYLYPASVRGRFRNLRSAVSLVLILIFLVLPWIRIGDEQAILLDLLHGRFAIFGLSFWAHDAPILVFVFGGAALLLALVTAIWGRIWCGWACPQSVFVDAIFRRIERFTEGTHLEQRALDRQDFSWNKLRIKLSKWCLFTLAALMISHSALAYFIEVGKLGQMIRTPPWENPLAFVFMLGFTLFTLFDFGWFKEQFCTLVCPYGRFQSVLMDENSLVVAYDQARGEPRRGSVSDRPQGDCIDCHRCVQVCPTGIDIRRGVQLECIACTACIDVCNEVMAKTKRAPDLIKYGTQAITESRTAPSVPVYQRVRVWAYGVLLLSCALGLGFIISERSPIEIDVLRAVDTPYQEILGQDGAPLVINHFVLHIRNQTFEDQNISLKISNPGEAAGVSIVAANHQKHLESGNAERTDVFVKFPKTLLHNGHGSVNIELATSGNKKTINKDQELHLVGPF